MRWSNMSLNLDKIENSEVEAVFEQYPDHLREKIFFLRRQIILTATESEKIKMLEETLKWGEPSYLTKTGSTIRLGWKKSVPQQYRMYFHCKTKLIDTFKELYGDIFKYEGSRAIIFEMDEIIPEQALRHCILLSLNYKNIKNLPLLGAQPLQ